MMMMMIKNMRKNMRNLYRKSKRKTISVQDLNTPGKNISRKMTCIECYKMTTRKIQKSQYKLQQKCTNLSNNLGIQVIQRKMLLPSMGRPIEKKRTCLENGLSKRRKH
uniref:Uncharacterized protein n=2 Tax=Cacopsylla melanoneura TaxID=428564 RepID=A0A8D8S431_9HEMI